MALKTILESLDGIEENLHALYAEKDGKFVLQVEGIDDHPAVVALRNGHNNSKRERDAAKEELRQLKSKYSAVPEDFDADEWDRLKAEDQARQDDPEGKDVRARIEAATASIKAQSEAKLERQKRDYEGRLAEKDEEAGRLSGELRRRVAEDGIKGALRAANIKESAIDRLARSFDADVEVVHEDGRYLARMKPDIGGEDVERFIANWAQTDEGKEFVSTIPPMDAPGSRGRGGGDGAGNPFSKKGWNMTGQGDLIKTNPAKAEQLAKAAGFKSLDAAKSAVRPLDA